MTSETPFMSSVPVLFTVTMLDAASPGRMTEPQDAAATVTGPLNVLFPLSRIVPGPLLLMPPLVIGTATSRSTSDVPFRHIKSARTAAQITNPLVPRPLPFEIVAVLLGQRADVHIAVDR